jgi:cellulose synthase/poly-beta-1,6-N-acetylglucosamine synthase-like glycosyltransferase
MIVLLVTFWVSLIAILYAYVGYPAVLWLVSRSRSETFSARNITEQSAQLQLPTVTMIVSAFNEEKVIRQKIENTLSLDYPLELLEIVIASDGSSDRTCEIVMEFSNTDVVLRHYEGRIGKTACLNRALPLAAGDIVVFSDANSTYEKGSLRALLRPFQDSTVGFVTGWTRYGSSEDMSAGYPLGIYSKLELVTKELESRLGSCIGADGAIFAIRKELYVPLKDYDINDLVIPFSINQRGYRGVLQPDAICFEKGAGSPKGEFHRQARITSRTIRAIMNYRQLLNPFGFGLLSFELFSHKLCKFLVPLFLLTLLASSLLLAAGGGFFLSALIAQGVFYVGAGAATFVSNTGFLSYVTETARTFVVVNAAIALAWVKYFQGETYTTWSPTKR